MEFNILTLLQIIKSGRFGFHSCYVNKYRCKGKVVPVMCHEGMGGWGFRSIALLSTR